MRTKIKFTTILLLITFFFTSCDEKEPPVLYGHINGTVFEEGTTTPIQGVTVILSPSGATKTTSSDGKFDFRDLTAKEYNLQASKSGYIGNTKTVTVTINEDTKADISLTKEQVSVLTVSSNNATNITATTASVIGNITELGSSNITAYGHCWSTSPDPTASLLTKTDKGSTSATGEYTSSFTNLQANTIYYVRAYATNSTRTAYSSEIQFLTEPGKATIVISTPTNIDFQTLTANGNIPDLGATNPTQHGFVWSINNSNPTTTSNDGIKELGATTINGSFLSNLSNFIAAKDYYIRAFVTNQYGTTYSDVITFKTKESFIDTRDQQSYKVVQIGDQIWMQENLDYETSNSWDYDNIPANGDIYGRLYTWDAVNSACPSGWHLPSDDEWKTLEMQLGMTQSEADATDYRGTDEGGKLKATATWNDPNIGATNSSGFSALSSGFRYNDYGAFSYVGSYTRWWSATQEYDSYAWCRLLYYDSDQVYRDYYSKSFSFAVRCLRN